MLIDISISIQLISQIFNKTSELLMDITISSFFFSYDFEKEVNQKLSDQLSSFKDLELLKVFLDSFNSSTNENIFYRYLAPQLLISSKYRRYALASEVAESGNMVDGITKGEKNKEGNQEKWDVGKLLEELPTPLPIPSTKDCKYVDFLDFMKKNRDIIEFFVGEHFDDASAVISRRPLFPYEHGISRGGVRSLKVINHFRQIQGILAAYLYLKEEGVTLSHILREDSNNELDWRTRYMNWSDLIAYEIDRGNEEIIKFIEDAITSENTTSTVTHLVLKSAIMSKNQKLNDLVIKLLLAAQRQEGLRQAILEMADFGRPGRLVKFLEVILKEDLLRFSSVKRAVACWTCLYDEESGDRLTKKEAEYFYKGLQSPEELHKLLKAKDNLQFLVGLIIVGMENIDIATIYASHILSSKEKHLQTVAAFFMSYFCDISQLELHDFIREYRENHLAVAFLVRQSNLNSYKFEKFSKAMNLTDEEKANFGYYSSFFEDKKENDITLANSVGSDEAALELYEIMKEIVESTKGKVFKIENTPFPNADYSVNLSDFICVMAFIALALAEKGNSKGIDLFEEVYSFKDYIDTSWRDRFVYPFLYPPRTKTMRKALVETLRDRIASIKLIGFAAFPRLKKPLDNNELELVASCYKYKSGELRYNLTSFLLSQSDSKLEPILNNLLHDRKGDVRLGGIDLLLSLRKDESRRELYNKGVVWLDDIKKPTPKELILIEQCQHEISLIEKPGFGLFDPSKPWTTFSNDLNKEKKVGLYEDIDVETCKAILEKLAQVFEKHADLEIKDEGSYSYLLGNVSWGWQLAVNRGLQKNAHFDDPFERMVFPDLWREALKDVDKRCLELLYWTNLQSRPLEKDEVDGKKSLDTHAYEQKLIGNLLVRSTEENNYQEAAWNLINTFFTFMFDETYLERCYEILRRTLVEFTDEELKGFAKTFEWKNQGPELTTVLDKSSILENAASALEQVDKTSGIDDTFPRRFKILWNLNLRMFKILKEAGKSGQFELSMDTLLQGYASDLITRNDIFMALLTKKSKQRVMIELAQYAGIWENKWYSRFLEEKGLDEIKDVARSIYDEFSTACLEAELSRGDSPNELTEFSLGIQAVVGSEYMARIITGLGREKLGRQNYGWGSADSKKNSLSHKLSICKPADDDNAEKLKACFEKYRIEPSLNTLAEIGMYSPKWQTIIESLTGVTGFEDGCLFFRAHSSEISESYEAEISRLTPIPIEDLCRGAVDINWFNRIYEELGEENLDILYDAAKYITDGGVHTRARKFVDAMLGRFDIDETENTIREKRNKDLLLAYALIPLPRYKAGEKKGLPKESFTKDLVRRYQFIQWFLTSSKQFGAQRQASEAEVVKSAMRNLATNAGYSDVTRMTWQVEVDLFKEMEHLFAEHEIEGYVVTLSSDDLGRCDLTFKNSNGKSVKSAPSKIKKTDIYQQLIDAKKEATEQWRRSRRSLELVMENEDTFAISELTLISGHPILRPLISQLVFGIVSDGDEKKGYRVDFTGFLDAETGSLTGFAASSSGSIDKSEQPVSRQVKENERLVICHPVHLDAAHVWSRWQHFVFEEKRKQPFKQIFRELYLPTEDEANSLDSRRYAGHQLQPKKAVATLKNRLWIVDPEEGLQKVDHKRGIIATIYALADWFSPSDIEPPTLEWVVFYDRKTRKPTKISDVPPVLFSEAMRDVDLVVSVAHAGNVDPEMSHSTIEMRRALVELSLPLFKLTNVKLTDNHAIIEGSRASYSIHLGSGVVHQKGGAQIAILPVHSQSRGRIFLPFVDDDPKTAEVLTKVLMFGDDSKIKDPSILNQIKK